MEPIYVELIPASRAFVNSSDFSSEDLNIFIESVETIARIERGRKERRKNHKLNTSEVVYPTPLSISFIAENSETEDDLIQFSTPVCAKQLRCKLFASHPDVSPTESFDENYFSSASRSESPAEARKESIETDDIVPLPSTDSGTESESGVYHLRPRTHAMTNPKYRTTRARIIGLVLKKEYADGGSQDELQKYERRERVLEGLMRGKDKCESLRLPSNESTSRKPIPGGKANSKKPTAEMRFIDKALRYLTL